VLLQAHSGKQGGEIRARKDPERAGDPRRVHRVALVMEEHPEANDRLPEGARGEAHLGRSLLVRGIVIMIVHPSSNKAEVLRASRS